jgi:hypothetical protein
MVVLEALNSLMKQLALKGKKEVSILMNRSSSSMSLYPVYPKRNSNQTHKPRPLHINLRQASFGKGEVSFN